MEPRIPLDLEKIKTFCEKWKVDELSLFGSVLRDDFGPESDVDVLVKISKAARISLYDLVDMRDDLQALFGREVDLLEADAVHNPFRRQERPKQ